jgi:hypothetical protein
MEWNMKVKPGLTGLLEFCEFLTEHKMIYRVDKVSFDSLMISFATVGIRYEVCFHEDEVYYSRFNGNEDVLTDFDELERDVKDRD